MKIDSKSLHSLAEDLLVQSGAHPDEASIVADVLIWSDLVGKPNQGVWRLPILCRRLKKGLYSSPCHPQLDMIAPALGLYNADNGMGHFVAHQAMNQAIDIARSEGIAAIFVRGSNFLGPAGYYAQLAANENMMGVVLSNSFPKVRAYKGNQAVLGTNPIAFSCPALTDRPLIVDLATSEQAGSTIRRKTEKSASKRNGENVLEPLGGAKGFALSIMVEVLAGVLSGAGFSYQVHSMYQNFNEPGNNGHFFCVIDIAKLMSLDQFQDRMATFVGWLKQSGEDVSYPGEQRASRREASVEKGISIDADVWQSLMALKKGS